MSARAAASAGVEGALESMRSQRPGTWSMFAPNEHEFTKTKKPSSPLGQSSFSGVVVVIIM